MNSKTLAGMKLANRIRRGGAQIRDAYRSKQTKLFVQAVLDANGSIKAAAGALGVHANTISRILNLAGIRFQDLRKQAHEATSRMLSDQANRPDGLYSMRPLLGREGQRASAVPNSSRLFVVRNGIDYRGVGMHQGEWAPEGLPALLQEDSLTAVIPSKKPPTQVKRFTELRKSI